MSRSRTGRLKLRLRNRSCVRTLNRSVNRHTTVMQYGLPRPRPPNPLAEIVRIFRIYFRWRKRFSKLMPGFFDYGAAERQAHEDAIRRENELTIQAAIAKVYGQKQAETCENPCSPAPICGSPK